MNKDWYIREGNFEGVALDHILKTKYQLGEKIDNTVVDTCSKLWEDRRREKKGHGVPKEPKDSNGHEREQ